MINQAKFKRLFLSDEHTLRTFLKSSNLNNYFDFHVCLSIHPFVRPFVRPVPSTQKLTSIPASVSQNVTNKSCLVCVKSKKYASWVTLRPQWDRCRQGKAKIHILDFKTTWSEFHMPSQTAPAEAGGKAELHILDFKIT